MAQGSSIYDPEAEQGAIRELGHKFTREQRENLLLGNWDFGSESGVARRSEGSFIPEPSEPQKDNNLVKCGAWSILIEYDYMGGNTAPTGFFITCVEGSSFLPAAEIIKHGGANDVKLLQKDPKAFAMKFANEMILAAEHHLKTGTALPEEELRAYLEGAAEDEGLTPEQAEVLRSLREDAGCGQVE